VLVAHILSLAIGSIVRRKCSSGIAQHWRRVIVGLLIRNVKTALVCHHHQGHRKYTLFDVATASINKIVVRIQVAIRGQMSQRERERP
jgi:hypothetical protein